MSHKRAKKIRRLMNEDDTPPKEFAPVYRKAKRLSTPSERNKEPQKQ